MSMLSVAWHGVHFPFTLCVTLMRRLVDSRLLAHKLDVVGQEGVPVLRARLRFKSLSRYRGEHDRSGPTIARRFQSELSVGVRFFVAPADNVLIETNWCPPTWLELALSGCRFCLPSTSWTCADLWRLCSCSSTTWSDVPERGLASTSTLQ